MSTLEFVVALLRGAHVAALVSLFGSGGTDLHLVSGTAPRMRKDGALVELPGFPEALAGDTIRSQASFRRTSRSSFPSPPRSRNCRSKRT